MEIVVYGMGRASRATRVQWALEEVGLPYRVVATSPRDPEYLKVNPMGKVPAMTVDGRVLTESAACCLWVADQRREVGLAPAHGTWEQAQVERWSFFVLTELEQACWLKAKHKFALPEHLRVAEVVEAAKWEFARSAAVLQGALAGGHHLVGDRFTVADLLAVHTLMWGKHAGFDVPGALLEYAGVHMGREAFARTVAADRS
jgi:glutathione S-transferase